jgi:hypothetical protein
MTIPPSTVTESKAALANKPPVRVVSTTKVGSLSGLPTVDDISLSSGDLILLTAETTAADNGPWVTASGAWTRPDWSAKYTFVF